MESREEARNWGVGRRWSRTNFRRSWGGTLREFLGDGVGVGEARDGEIGDSKGRVWWKEWARRQGR